MLEVRAGLARLIDQEKPNAVHAVAMQTMVMSSLALARTLHRPLAVMLHLTGLGYLGQAAFTCCAHPPSAGACRVAPLRGNPQRLASRRKR